jgi:hypothetical protein
MDVEKNYFWEDFFVEKPFSEEDYNNNIKRYVDLIYSNNIKSAVSVLKRIIYYSYNHNISKDKILNDIINISSKIEIIYFTKGVLATI